MTRVLLAEFPDYPVSAIPEMPPGFVDTSWRNDTCPSFTGHGIRVLIDYPNAADREIPTSPRFCVLTESDGSTLFEHEHWRPILTFLMGAVSHRIGASPDGKA